MLFVGRKDINMSNYHFNFNDRKEIQHGIEADASFKAIALKLNVSPSAVIREIIRNKSLKVAIPIFKKYCELKDSCPKASFNCHQKCVLLKIPKCNVRDKKRHVCNSCPNINYCNIDKYFYRADVAQKKSISRSINSRHKIKLSASELEDLSLIIKNLLKKGYSPYDIVTTHPEINISESTLYRYIENGYLKNFDIDKFSLKRVVSRRPTKKKKEKEVKYSSTYYQNHTYKDYLQFKVVHPDYLTTEMDTVYNSQAGPYIQTFSFESSNLQIGFLHTEKTYESMSNTLNKLQDILSNQEFKDLFSLLLTDRGSEFKGIENFEVNSSTGEIRSNIFYCDARHPEQKAHVENNHNILREILPNSCSFKDLTQKDLDLIFSHINSKPRKVLGGKTPYQIFEFMYGHKTLDKLNINYIYPGKLNLSPSLIFHK